MQNPYPDKSRKRRAFVSAAGYGVLNLAVAVWGRLTDETETFLLVGPFMLLPIYNVLIKIDKNVVNAARDLGANSFQTFCKITFPLSLPGVISGITMVFVPSLTTFVISDLLGGSKILLIGNVIEQKFKQGNNWNVGSGLSLVLMVFILISMAIMQKYDKDGEGAAF